MTYKEEFAEAFTKAQDALIPATPGDEPIEADLLMHYCGNRFDTSLTTKNAVHYGAGATWHRYHDGHAGSYTFNLRKGKFNDTIEVKYTPRSDSSHPSTQRAFLDHALAFQKLRGMFISKGITAEIKIPEMSVSSEGRYKQMVAVKGWPNVTLTLSVPDLSKTVEALKQIDIRLTAGGAFNSMHSGFERANGILQHLPQGYRERVERSLREELADVGITVKDIIPRRDFGR